MLSKECLLHVLCSTDNNIPKTSLVSFNNATVGGIHMAMIKRFTWSLFISFNNSKNISHAGLMPWKKKSDWIYLKASKQNSKGHFFSLKKHRLGHFGQAHVLFNLGFCFLCKCFLFLLLRFCMPEFGSWRVPLKKYLFLFTQL